MIIFIDMRKMVTINYVIFIFSKIVFERVATANSFLELDSLSVMTF